jgi:hypothetical protein
MKSFHTAAVLFVVLLVSACGPPLFKLETPPMLSVADITRPTPPEPRQKEMKIGTQVLFKQISTRPMPNFGEMRLGLGEFETPGGGGAMALIKSALPAVAGLVLGGDGGGLLDTVMNAAGEMASEKMTEAGLQMPQNLSDVLVPKLLAAGISKVVDLAQGNRVLVLMEEEITGPSKSKATVRWASTMDQMIFVGKVSSADYVLYGRFETASIQPEEHEVPLFYDEAEMRAYRVKYAEFKRRSKEEVARLEQLFIDYKGQYDREMQRYKGEGGQLLQEDGEPNRALQAEQGYEGFQARYWRHRKVLDAGLREVPSPEKLEGEAHGKTEKRMVPVATIRLVARLLDAATGEIVWWEKLSKKDENLGVALNDVLDRMLHDVLAQSGTRVQLPASRPVELDEF